MSEITVPYLDESRIERDLISVDDKLRNKSIFKAGKFYKIQNPFYKGWAKSWHFTVKSELGYYYGQNVMIVTIYDENKKPVIESFAITPAKYISEFIIELLKAYRLGFDRGKNAVN